jgi:hypothetical protein
MKNYDIVRDEQGYGLVVEGDQIIQGEALVSTLLELVAEMMEEEKRVEMMHMISTPELASPSQEKGSPSS